MKKINFFQNVLLQQYGFPAGNNGLFSKKSLLTMAKTFPKTLGMFLFILLVGAWQANVVKAEDEVVPKDLSGLLTIPKTGADKTSSTNNMDFLLPTHINWLQSSDTGKTYSPDPKEDGRIGAALLFAAEIVIPQEGGLKEHWKWPGNMDSAYFTFAGADSIRVYKWNHFSTSPNPDATATRIAIFFKSDSLINIVQDPRDTTAWTRVVAHARPVPGNKPATLQSIDLPDNRTFTVKELKWKTKDGQDFNAERFDFKTEYLAYITMEPKAGFTTYSLPVGHSFFLGWSSGKTGDDDLGRYTPMYKNTTIVSRTDTNALFSILFPPTYKKPYGIDSINILPLRMPSAGFEPTDTAIVKETKDDGFTRGGRNFVTRDSSYWLTDFEWKTEAGSAVTGRFDPETKYVLTSKIRVDSATLYGMEPDSVKYRFDGYGNGKVDSVLTLYTKVDIDPDSAHKGTLNIYFSKSTETTISLDSVTNRFKAPVTKEPLKYDTVYYRGHVKENDTEIDTDTIYRATISWHNYSEKSYGKSNESIGSSIPDKTKAVEGSSYIAKITIDTIAKEWTNYKVNIEDIRKWAGNLLKDSDPKFPGLIDSVQGPNRDTLIIYVKFKTLPKTVELDPNDWKHLYPRGDETPKTSVGGEPLNYKGTVEWKYNDGTEVKIETEKFRKNVVYTAYVTLEATKDGYGVEGFAKKDLDAIAETIDSVAKSTEGFTGQVTESVEQNGTVVTIKYKATQGGVLLPISTDQALELYGIPVVDENMAEWESKVEQVEGNLITPEPVLGVSDPKKLTWEPNPTGGGVFNATDEYNTVLAVKAVPGYKLSNKQYIKIAGSHRLEVLSASDEGTTLLKIYVKALPLVTERNLAISAVVGSAPQRSMAATAELQESPITWKRGEIELVEGDVFESGTTYKAELTVKPQEGYTLAGLRNDFFRVLGHVTTHPGVTPQNVTIGKDSVDVKVTFAEATTGIQGIPASGVKVSSAGGVLKVSGLSAGEAVSVYNLQGALVYRQAAVSGEQKIDLASGIYIVVTEKAKVKVLHKK